MTISLLIDFLSASGLGLTCAGALIAAKAVMVRPQQAAHIAVSRIAHNKLFDNVTQPAAQNLIAASRGAQKGFRLVAAGTAMQIVSPIVGFISKICNL